MAPKRKPGRPRGSGRYVRYVTVGLPLELMDMVDSRKERSETDASAVRRCLEEFQALTQELANNKILVAVSAQDRKDLERMVQNGVVTSVDFATSDAIHRYPEIVRKEIEERRRLLGTA